LWINGMFSHTAVVHHFPEDDPKTIRLIYGLSKLNI